MVGVAVVTLWGGVRSVDARCRCASGFPGAALYSELHEALRAGSPAADSMLRVQRLRSPGRLWRIARSAMAGEGD